MPLPILECLQLNICMHWAFCLDISDVACCCSYALVVVKLQTVFGIKSICFCFFLNVESQFSYFLFHFGK